MRKLLICGLLSLTACAGSPPAPNPALDVFRETGAPLTEELKERRIAAMTSMIRATGLEPVEALLVRNSSTLSAKVVGAGGCTVSLWYAYRPAYGSKAEEASFSLTVYNANGEHLVQSYPSKGDDVGFDPEKNQDLKDWAEVRHCSGLAK